LYSRASGAHLCLDVRAYRIDVANNLSHQRIDQHLPILRAGAITILRAAGQKLEGVGVAAGELDVLARNALLRLLLKTLEFPLCVLEFVLEAIGKMCS
jgi:hypothetical protein